MLHITSTVINETNIDESSYGLDVIMNLLPIAMLMGIVVGVVSVIKFMLTDVEDSPSTERIVRTVSEQPSKSTKIENITIDEIKRSIKEGKRI